MAAPVKVAPAILSQGFINAYYAQTIANNDLEPEQIHQKLATLFGSRNPILLIRQSSELRTKEEIVAKFAHIKARGPIYVECQGFNGDYLSLSGHPAGEPSPFHLVTWGTMKIGLEPAVPFTESFVLSGSRATGSSYSYSINRSVLLFPTLTADIDEGHSEAPVSSDAPAPASATSSDVSTAPPPSNRVRDSTTKARTPKKVQDSSDSPSAAAAAAPGAAAEPSVKEKQEKQAAPTSYASAARMAPSAPKDDPRPPRTGGAAAAKADGGAAAVAAGGSAAAAAHKEPAEDIPNGIIVKKIPEGVRLTKELAEALLPGKKIASVQPVADKSHGFIYLASEDDFRHLPLAPSVVTVSHGGSAVTVTIDRKKPRTPTARSGETHRGRPQPHTDGTGFTQVTPRSRGGRSDAHDSDGDGQRRPHGGRGMSGGRGGGKA